MKGSPLFRTLLVFVLLLIAAIPLARLTRAAASRPFPARIETVRSKSSAHIEIVFAHPADHFQLLHLGNVVWDSRTQTNSAEKEIEMEFPKEGVDLEVKASWPPGTPLTAIRIVVTPPNGAPIERTVWGKENIDEVATFQ